jgi:hypothetical protein
VFEGLAEPPEGAEILVTELEAKKNSLQTVLATVEAPPYINLKGLDKLMRFIDNMRGNLP